MIYYMLGQLQLAHIFGMKQKQYIITIYGKCNWLHQWIKCIHIIYGNYILIYTNYVKTLHYICILCKKLLY